MEGTKQEAPAAAQPAAAPEDRAKAAGASGVTQ
jgi:hypothetical protein